MTTKRRARRGEGRTAEKVRSLLEAKGFTIDFFWFQAPLEIKYGGCAVWGAFGKDANGWGASFCSWDSMSEIARLKNPAISVYSEGVLNSFEVHATEEKGN